MLQAVPAKSLEELDRVMASTVICRSDQITTKSWVAQRMATSTVNKHAGLDHTAAHSSSSFSPGRRCWHEAAMLIVRFNALAPSK